MTWDVFAEVLLLGFAVGFYIGARVILSLRKDIIIHHYTYGDDQKSFHTDRLNIRPKYLISTPSNPTTVP